MFNINLEKLLYSIFVPNLTRSINFVSITFISFLNQKQM